MQRCELGVAEALRDDSGCRAGYELDDAWGYAGFGEDLVDEVVGVGCRWGGFPDDDVADQCGCYRNFRLEEK